MTASDQAASDRVSVRAEPSPEALQAFVASVRDLPVFSGTALQIMRSAGRDDVGARELADLIMTDAALSAPLLRVVNSPFYGLPRRIGTVADAVAVLGFDVVRRTVAAAMLQLRPAGTWKAPDAARDLWRHELLCASLSRHVAAVRGVDPEVAYMAGLLHDVGRLVMQLRYPDDDLPIHRPGDADGAAIAREQQRFGFDHAQVGGALLELWGLPQAIVQAAHQHADASPPDERGAASVWDANRVAHAAFAELDALDDEPARPWMVEIDLAPNVWRRMRAEIAAVDAAGD